jgi:uncharacterized protein
VVQRTQKLVQNSTNPSFYIAIVDILGLFLLGLYAGRLGLFQETEKNIRFIRRMMWGALVLGMVGLGWGPMVNRFARIARDGSPLAEAVRFMRNSTTASLAKLYHQQALAIFYGSFLLVLLRRAVWQRLLRPFASIGRMALTNYIAQCVVASMLFYGYGLGLYGKLGAFWAAVLAVGLYLIQIPLSVWWLKHFRFGPMEWVWRSLTYRKAQPMRATS